MKNINFKTNCIIRNNEEMSEISSLLISFNTIVLCRYESPWYTFSPRIRSLYVLSLRSCLNFPTLTAGGLIVLNLQSFAEVGI